MTSVSAEAADGWLLPILRELLGKPALEKIESTVGTSYWRTAVDSGAVTDAACWPLCRDIPGSGSRMSWW